MHEAGIPPSALQFLPGDGAIGARIVAAPQIAGVVFTGSDETARSINIALAILAALLFHVVAYLPPSAAAWMAQNLKNAL